MIIQYCTAMQELMTGSEHVYINNCFPTQPSMAAQDDSLAEQLWDLTLDVISRKIGFRINFE